jgi:hypothetical protein
LNAWITLALLAGCGYDPVGRYSGEASVHVDTHRQTTPTNEDGESTAESTTARWTDDGVEIAVTRTGEGELAIAIGSWCTVRARPNADDSRTATLDPVRGAECPVDAANYQGPARFHGTVQLDTAGTIEIDLDGTIRAGPQTGVGSVWGSYDYRLRGRRR